MQDQYHQEINRLNRERTQLLEERKEYGSYSRGRGASKSKI